MWFVNVWCGITSRCRRDETFATTPFIVYSTTWMSPRRIGVVDVHLLAVLREGDAEQALFVVVRHVLGQHRPGDVTTRDDYERARLLRDVHVRGVGPAERDRDRAVETRHHRLQPHVRGRQNRARLRRVRRGGAECGGRHDERGAEAEREHGQRSNDGSSHFRQANQANHVVRAGAPSGEGIGPGPENLKRRRDPRAIAGPGLGPGSLWRSRPGPGGWDTRTATSRPSGRR